MKQWGWVIYDSVVILVIGATVYFTGTWWGLFLMGALTVNRCESEDKR